MVGSASFDWVATDEGLAAGLARLRDQIDACAELGATLVGLTHAGVMRHNHFTRGPPLAEQLTRARDALGRAAATGAADGVVLAAENHGDYRPADLAAAIEAVGSPWLRATLDTGGANRGGREPARRGGGSARARGTGPPQRTCGSRRPRPRGVPKILGAPIGHGDLPLDAIVATVARAAAGPPELPLCIDVVPHRTADPARWVREGVMHARALGRLLRRAGGVSNQQPNEE